MVSGIRNNYKRKAEINVRNNFWILCLVAYIPAVKEKKCVPNNTGLLSFLMMWPCITFTWFTL